MRRPSSCRLSVGAGPAGIQYRKLHRVHLQLQEEKRRLDRKIEDYQRELREAKRKLESLDSKRGSGSIRSDH